MSSASCSATRQAKQQARRRGPPARLDQREGATAKRPSAIKTRPKTENQVALSGYCPVSLVSDKRLVQGQAEYTVTHEGRLYRFANLLTFNLFRRDPERYVPVNNGNCPVAQLDRGVQQPGDPNYGVLYQGRLFLCSNDADRKPIPRGARPLRRGGRGRAAASARTASRRTASWFVATPATT